MKERLRILARAAAIVVITCLLPATLRAGDLQAVLVDANYVKPVRWNAGGSLFFSNHFSNEGGGGPIVGGSVGRGGMQVWGGFAVLSNVGGGDFRAVVTRTWDNPRGASANSTYLGGEIGFGTIGRLSVGYAKRISGPSTSHDHVVTWGIGLEIPVWFRESPAKHVVSQR